MNHLNAILNAYHHSQATGDTAYLATIVHTQGSTYRRSGARMLITHPSTHPNSHPNIHQPQLTGMVSGGCLEQDILCHIQQQPDRFNPFVITYDTTTDEDILWGFGLGCDGIVEVLVERLTESLTEGLTEHLTERLAMPSIAHPLTFIQTCFDRQQSGVMATVFRSQGRIPVGTRLLRHGNGEIVTNLEDSEWLQAIGPVAHRAAQTQQSTHHHIALSNGFIDLFMEVIQPPTPLWIFGAGQDALPLVQFAHSLGWRTTVVDCRSQANTIDRFSTADQIMLTRRDLLAQQISIDSRSVAVVMTHNYFDDLEILKLLLPSAAQYIGILGSRQRTTRLLQTLESHLESNLDWQNQLSQLHTPIGLDIGAETPEEIAIAIIAEIQATLTHRSAGFLTHRPTAIHPSPSPSLDRTYAIS